MSNSNHAIFLKMLQGYHQFREKYALGDNSVMSSLADYGQKPTVMVVSCCDSRVDPALILQCEPGDLFVVRNVANIVPPYEKDEAHHGTSAALEFGICFLKVSDLILFGHSQCGGIKAWVEQQEMGANDFISRWVSLIPKSQIDHRASPNAIQFDANEWDQCAKFALNQSYENCLTFPWINKKVVDKELNIHLWYFDVKKGQIHNRSANGIYEPL